MKDLKEFVKKLPGVEPLVRYFRKPADLQEKTHSDIPEKPTSDTNIQAIFTSNNSNPVTASTSNPGINLVANMPKKYSSNTATRSEFYENVIKAPISNEYTIDKTKKIETVEELAALMDSDKYVKELPPSPAKPPYITDASHNRILSVQAFLDLVKNGAEPTQTMVVGAYTTGGHPGRFSDKLNAVVKHVPPCKGKHNFVNNLSEEVVNMLTDKDLEQLAYISLTEPTRFAEYVGMAKVNPSLMVKLIYAKGEVPPLHLLPSFYNQTPNIKPDYVSHLPQAINDVTHIGVDFKYTEGYHPNQNVLLGCSTNIERHMVVSHKILSKHIEQRLATLSEKDKDIAEQLMQKLEQNLVLYQQNRDLNAAICSYNGLRNDYLPFLVENTFGMTLLAPIDRSDFVIRQDTKRAYLERFMAYYSNSDSSLNDMLNRQAEANFGKMPDENHFLTALAKWNFPDK